MKKLYEKSELGFALLSIGIYVVSMSLANNLSKLVGVQDLFNTIFCLGMMLFILRFLYKNKLLRKHGLCKSEPMKRENLYYFPLLLIVSANLWFGFKGDLDFWETLLGIVTMLCVGFLEELIFRGFLFKALAAENLKSAVIISSVTFGIGHIVNLISGAEFFQTILQIFYATALGFLFTVLFYKGKSLLPCIVTHSLLNGLSVVANGEAASLALRVASAVFLSLVSVTYGAYIIKRGSDS